MTSTIAPPAPKTARSPRVRARARPAVAAAGPTRAELLARYRPPSESRAAPASQPGPTRPAGPGGGLAAVSRLVAVGLGLLTLFVALVSLLAVMVLGPFGAVLAIAVGPLYLAYGAAAGAASWLESRAARRSVRAADRALEPGAGEAAAAPVEGGAPAALAPTEDRASTRRERRTTFHRRLERSVLEIRDLHHSLPALLDRLERERDGLSVLLQLRALRDALEPHFRNEEAPGGLFEELQGLRPDLGPDVGTLATQHEEILAALDALLLPDPEADLPSRSEVLEKIRRHQRNEDELVQLAYGFRIEGDLGA